MRKRKNNDDFLNEIMNRALAGAIAGIVITVLENAISYQSEEDLQSELNKALASEDYERCAIIRDKINTLKK